MRNPSRPLVDPDNRGMRVCGGCPAFDSTPLSLVEKSQNKTLTQCEISWVELYFIFY